MACSNDTSERLLGALTALPRTKAQRSKLPPDLLVATAHDEHVMIFLRRVGDAIATANVILAIITLAESGHVIKSLSQSGGLIRKRIDIDRAQVLKDSLARADTDVEFVRPVDD